MTSPLDNLCGPGKDLAREAPDEQTLGKGTITERI